MGGYTPVKGDRVRVVIEAEVPWTSMDTAAFDIGEASYIADKDAKNVVSIEKIESPVTVFKPGQTVRNKNTGWLYSLTRDGYLSHQYGVFFAWDSSTTEQEHFSSKRYELVDLSR